MDLRILADVNISPVTVSILADEGWPIIRATELLSASASDREIISLAENQEFVVVTQDLDFSALLARTRRSRPSVVTLRLRDTGPRSVSVRLREVIPGFEAELREGVVLTVLETRVRVHSLPLEDES